MDIRQISNQKKYDLAASSYDFISFVLSLGQANKIYREVANNVDMKASKTIVELGCGPASVIPFLVEKTHNSTQIIGVDFSEQMIEVANHKKEINNWGNVEFKCMDMYDFPETKLVDAVIFCLALTAIPNSLKALQKGLSILKPGGQLIIIDSIPLHSRWWHPFTNAYIYLKSLVVGAKPTRKILSFIQGNMIEIQIKEMAFGIYTVITARKSR